MVDRERLELIADPDLPAFGVLLGDSAVELLDSVLAEVGGHCESARPAQVRYVPSSSVTVQYETEVKWEQGPTTTETMVAASGISVPDGTPLLQSEDTTVAVWRYPNDPFLPGLAPAADPERVRRLLGQLGAQADKARLRRRAYRPGRRAVIEAVTPRARIFLKVVRPDSVAELQAKHSSMGGHVPVPHSYGWSEELGLVALQAMPGKTLRNALEGGTRRLPTGPQIAGLLDSLPSPPVAGGRVAGPVRSAPGYARLLKTVSPELTERIDAIIDALGEIGDEPSTSVHGDFHSSQILIKGTSIVGLIDVDSTGHGELSNDLAGLIGHLSTLALASRARRNIDRYGAALIADFDRMTNPTTLRLRTAAVVLGFATGAFRVQEAHWPAETEHRVALAERWVESAGAIGP